MDFEERLKSGAVDAKNILTCIDELVQRQGIQDRPYDPDKPAIPIRENKDGTYSVLR